MRLLEVTETPGGFRCGVKCGQTVGTHATREPDWIPSVRPWMSRSVRGADGKPCCDLDRGALLLSLAPAEDPADDWPRSVTMSVVVEDLEQVVGWARLVRSGWGLATPGHRHRRRAETDKYVQRPL